MTQETLDLRRSLHIVRRHRIAVGVVAALGLLAGVAFGLLYPSRPTSSALIVLAPTTRSVPTQVVIAGSEPVLQAARKRINDAPSLTTMKRDIHVRNPNPDIISVSATGKSAAQAERIANAVAHSYVAYASAAKEALLPVALTEMMSGLGFLTWISRFIVVRDGASLIRFRAAWSTGSLPAITT